MQRGIDMKENKKSDEKDNKKNDKANYSINTIEKLKDVHKQNHFEYISVAYQDEWSYICNIKSRRQEQYQNSRDIADVYKPRLKSESPYTITLKTGVLLPAHNFIQRILINQFDNDVCPKRHFKNCIDYIERIFTSNSKWIGKTKVWAKTLNSDNEEYVNNDILAHLEQYRLRILELLLKKLFGFDYQQYVIVRDCCNRILDSKE
jgi:hypothetical protein